MDRISPTLAEKVVQTNLSVLRWSNDGTRVTKHYDVAGNRDKLGPRSIILDHHYCGSQPWARHFAYELRVNQMLTRHPPPVPTPRLVGYDRRRRWMDFEVIPGSRLGPKFPLSLSDADLTSLITLSTALRGYRHNARWLRRFPIHRRLRRAHQKGLLTGPEHSALQGLRSRLPIRWVFTHADINPSNVITGEGGTFVCDWEWAGLYPDGYDLAFLWFVLNELPDARAEVERHIIGDATIFWLCALLIELLHLEWFTGEFRARHEANRELLLGHLLASPERHAES